MPNSDFIFLTNMRSLYFESGASLPDAGNGIKVVPSTDSLTPSQMCKGKGRGESPHLQGNLFPLHMWENMHEIITFVIYDATQ